MGTTLFVVAYVGLSGAVVRLNVPRLGPQEYGWPATWSLLAVLFAVPVIGAVAGVWLARPSTRGMLLSLGTALALILGFLHLTLLVQDVVLAVAGAVVLAVVLYLYIRGFAK